jgi:ethanolamine ammonia-lyase large subunit
MGYSFNIGSNFYQFKDLKTLLAKATPLRSGDELAKLGANSNAERIAAQYALSEVPLTDFIENPIIPYENDEVTRLIIDNHDSKSFSKINQYSVGQFRDWLLSYEATNERISELKMALTPEMVAAVSKLMRNQDLISVASKIEVITKFRNTIGQKGRVSIRLQPNHPTETLKEY